MSDGELLFVVLNNLDECEDNQFRGFQSQVIVLTFWFASLSDIP